MFEASAGIISHALQQNLSLTALNLEDNALGGGFVEIAEALCVNTRLRELILSVCRANQRTARSIAHSMD